MSDATSRLSLPYILPNQAQKHVTHNEALALLDALVQLVVEAFDATMPPDSFTDGQCWALGSSPQGAWADHGDEIAVAQTGGWVFLTPQDGWLAVGRGSLELRVWTGTVWANYTAGALNHLQGVGINTSYDATNALAVSAPATLLSHGETGGHQVKVNKAASTDTASVLFQTGWTGHAEMGTAGSDDFEIKTSADGTTWFTGLRLTAATGQLNAPNGLEVTGTLSGSAVMQNPVDITPDLVMTTGAFGLGSIGSPNLSNLDDQEIPNGFYSYLASSTGTPNGQAGYLLQVRRFGGVNEQTAQLAFDDNGGGVFVRQSYGGSYRAWQTLYTTGNTTVDANGFVKAASPIVRLAQDGIEEPVVPVGAEFIRLDVGRYRVLNVDPLATSGWQIEVPQDHNGNRLVFVTPTYDAAKRVLDVTTQAVVWDAQTGQWAGGAPLDIPAGRWVDIRFSDPVQATPEAES